MSKETKQLNLDVLNEVVEGLSGVENFKTKSPITKYIRYNAGTGKFMYWDSSKKENVDLGPTLRFTPIAFRSSLGGFVDEKFVSSTEFQRNEEEITVFADRKMLVQGKYDDLKDKLKTKGIKYEKNIYAVGEGNEIIKLTLRGAALAGYFQIMAEHKIYETNLIGKMIEFGKSQPLKKGAVKYFSILLTGVAKLNDKQLEEVKVLDSELKAYFEARTTSNATAKDDEIILSTDEEKELKEMKKKAKALDHGDEITADDFFGDF